MNTDLRNIATKVFMDPGFPRLARAPGRRRKSRPLGAGLGGEIDRALAADIIEMRVEKIAYCTATAVAQHHEEIVIRAQLALRRELAECIVERDAVQLDAAVLAGPGAVRQPASVDEAGDELDRAQFAD